VIVPTKRKPKTIAQEVAAVAVLLQKLVRLKASNADGFCFCVTCDKQDHYKNMQGGHFIERGKAPTKLLEENIHPQCPYCNQWGMKKSSCVLTYRKYMVDMYGKKFVDQLEQEAKQVKKYTREELATLKADYKAQIAYHEERIG